MSDQWLWKLEGRTRFAFGWSCIVDQLNRKVVGETGEFYARRYPEWTLRLHDTSTGEVIHLGPDGTPLTEVDK